LDKNYKSMFLDKTIFIYIYSNTNNFQMINFTQLKNCSVCLSPILQILFLLLNS
jgi:hypothetical protein